MMLHIFNSKIFFIIALGVILLTSNFVSILTVGGILLVFGASYVYVGNIFYSVITYAIGDICWLYNAYEHDDFVGVISISFGIIVGILVTNKMRIGKFRKSIRKDSGEVH